MTTELTLLAWTLVLALVQVLLPAVLRVRDVGSHYGVSPRDQPAPAVGVITGRLQRAQSNLFETLPLFAAAVLIAHVAERSGPLTLWGSTLYLAARIVYIPLYAFGIPVVRSLAWAAGFAGLVMVIVACLR